jgi:DNA-binding GntR family transcriptional regulator
MKAFKSTSLSDQVFDKLENDIIHGVYAKGEILTELKLVEQLGVSRTPIRDALRRLEQERLIADTGKGSVVLGITDEDLRDIMNIRERIEGLCAYYAAKNITAEGIKELAHITDLQDFYFNKGDTERNTLTEFNSNNTELLTVEETKAKIAALAYIKDELAKGKK